MDQTNFESANEEHNIGKKETSKVSQEEKINQLMMQPLQQKVANDNVVTTET